LDEKPLAKAATDFEELTCREEMATRHGLGDNGKSRSTAANGSVNFATW